jgi:hypothetical protein
MEYKDNTQHFTGIVPDRCRAVLYWDLPAIAGNQDCIISQEGNTAATQNSPDNILCRFSRLLVNDRENLLNQFSPSFIFTPSRQRGSYGVDEGYPRRRIRGDYPVANAG